MDSSLCFRGVLGRAMLAKAVEISTNTKLGLVSATSVSQVTCPKECPWYDDGKWGRSCYANNNFIGLQTKKLNQGKGDYLDAAREEAELIAGLSGERPLRLHIVGDCKDRAATEIVSNAVDGYRARHGQPSWTYTRAWEQVPRESWGAVSVLASCESARQVRRAHSRGYATAIVVGVFERETAYMSGGIKIVPCPQETGRVPGLHGLPALLEGRCPSACQNHHRISSSRLSGRQGPTNAPKHSAVRRSRLRESNLHFLAISRSRKSLRLP